MYTVLCSIVGFQRRHKYISSVISCYWMYENGRLNGNNSIFLQVFIVCRRQKMQVTHPCESYIMVSVH